MQAQHTSELTQIWGRVDARPSAESAAAATWQQLPGSSACECIDLDQDSDCIDLRDDEEVWHSCGAASCVCSHICTIAHCHTSSPPAAKDFSFDGVALPAALVYHAPHVAQDTASECLPRRLGFILLLASVQARCTLAAPSRRHSPTVPWGSICAGLLGDAYVPGVLSIPYLFPRSVSVTSSMAARDSAQKCLLMQEANTPLYHPASALPTPLAPDSDSGLTRPAEPRPEGDHPPYDPVTSVLATTQASTPLSPSLGGSLGAMPQPHYPSEAAGSSGLEQPQGTSSEQPPQFGCSAVEALVNADDSGSSQGSPTAGARVPNLEQGTSSNHARPAAGAAATLAAGSAAGWALPPGVCSPAGGSLAADTPAQAAPACSLPSAPLQIHVSWQA